MGVYYFPNGDIYEGEWKDSAFHGVGKFTSAGSHGYASVLSFLLSGSGPHWSGRVMCVAGRSRETGGTDAGTAGAC